MCRGRRSVSVLRGVFLTGAGNEVIRRLADKSALSRYSKERYETKPAVAHNHPRQTLVVRYRGIRLTQTGMTSTALLKRRAQIRPYVKTARQDVLQTTGLP